MARNALEFTDRAEKPERPVGPVTEKTLNHIRKFDPELAETIEAHASGAVGHQGAAWTNENTTRGMELDGQSVEVMETESTAYRLYQAMYDNVKHNLDPRDLAGLTESARELIDMMTTPHRNAAKGLPEETRALNERLSENLENLADEMAGYFSKGAKYNTVDRERFCDCTETLGGISRDLERATNRQADSPEDFDTALSGKNPELWEKLRHGGEDGGAPDIFPADGKVNPNAEQLLHVYTETARGWSWRHEVSVRNTIVEGATGWLNHELQATEDRLRENGQDEEARDTAGLRERVEHAGELMHWALNGLSRNQREQRKTLEKENFQNALGRIAEVANNPERVPFEAESAAH